MNSAIYTGWVRHRRYHPKNHRMCYRVFMLLLDLAEVDEVFATSRCWSATGRAPARFKRSDFLGDPALPLNDSVRKRVQEETGVYPTGAVRMLANLRYFGFIINPISCYYCFDQDDRLQYIVAEVTNTPWNERHSYVLSCEPDTRIQRMRFSKRLHVSPFNPMAVTYDWRSNTPGQSLRIHMQNWTQRGQEDDSDSERNNEKTGDGHCHSVLEFDATLVLQREEISAKRLNRLIWAYPLMTLKVLAAIYWQALKLFVKGVPVIDHPQQKI